MDATIIKLPVLSGTAGGRRIVIPSHSIDTHLGLILPYKKQNWLQILQIQTDRECQSIFLVKYMTAAKIANKPTEPMRSAKFWFISRTYK